MITKLPIATTASCMHCAATQTIPGFCGALDEFLMRLETEFGWYFTGRVGDIATTDDDAERLLCPGCAAERVAQLAREIRAAEQVAS